MEENKVVEIEEVDEVVIGESKTTKCKSFMKRHGKKIAIGAVAAAALIGGIMLGKKSRKTEEEFEETEEDFSEDDYSDEETSEDEEE